VSYLNISNVLSLCRVPLALLFVPQIKGLRIASVVLAATTDYLDGFLARRFQKTSQLGAVLDPVMDKFFMFIVVGTLLWDRSLAPLSAIAMLSRDFILMAFLAYLGLSGSWRGLRAHSLWWGKVSTVLQYLVLFIVVAGGRIPFPVFLIFPLLGLLYLGELVLYVRQAH
jgi:CDP-diacylglycerol---glycerol-3-phosphate 3-phosphatidyltransferase